MKMLLDRCVNYTVSWNTVLFLKKQRKTCPEFKKTEYYTQKLLYHLIYSETFETCTKTISFLFMEPTHLQPAQKAAVFFVWMTGRLGIAEYCHTICTSEDQWKI